MLVVVGTNGHRAVRHSTDIVVSDDFRVIVDHVWKGAAKAFKGVERLTVATSDSHIRLAADQITAWVRTTEGPYPDYGQVWPVAHTEWVVRATVETAALQQAVERVLPLASDITHRLRFQFRGNMLTITTQTPDLGSGEIAVPIRREDSGAELTVGFNGNYALATLAALDAEHVTIRCKDPERATTWEPVEPNGYDALLMPLRLLD